MPKPFSACSEIYTCNRMPQNYNPIMVGRYKFTKLFSHYEKSGVMIDCIYWHK